MSEHEAQSLAERVRAATLHTVTVEPEDAYFVVQVLKGSGDTWTLRDEADWGSWRKQIKPD